jgi:TolB protein
MKLIVMFFMIFVQAKLHIEVNKWDNRAMPIAIIDFKGIEKIGKDISAVVSNDLAKSGFFKVMDPKDYPQNASSIESAVDFKKWQDAKVDAVVVGNVENKDNGKIMVAFKLIEISTQKEIAAFTYTLDYRVWRKLAHKVSDAIYERITGEQGDFCSEIVYVAEYGQSKARIKRLAKIGIDGNGQSFLTEGKDIVIAPRLSKKGKKISYLSIYKKVSRAIIFDFSSNTFDIINNTNGGIMLSPRFSPDGSEIVASISKNGFTNIFKKRVGSDALTKITHAPALEISPSFSPDGKEIIFVSDKSGSLKVYKMFIYGSSPTRVSIGDGEFSSPDWSPCGKFITYVKRKNGSANLCISKSDGTEEKILTQGNFIDSPTWTYSGRRVVYSKNNGRSAKIYSINANGKNEQEIITPQDACDPCCTSKDF